MTRRRRVLTPILVLALALLAGGIAQADMSRGVIAAFKGQLVISKGALDEGKNDKETIAKIKAAKLTELAGEAGDEVTSWSFHYTAFLKATGSSSLKMEFYRDGKQLAADKRLDGVDPKSAVLEGDISINEDEGLAKGKSYTIKLLNEKNAVVAETKLLMK